MQPINLQELDVKSLKELAYNFIAQKEEIERSQVFQQHRDVLNNLQLVNQEILIRDRILTAINSEIEVIMKEENNIPKSDSVFINVLTAGNGVVNSTEDNKLIT